MIKGIPAFEQFIHYLHTSTVTFYRDEYGMMGHENGYAEDPFNKGVYYCVKGSIPKKHVKDIIQRMGDLIASTNTDWDYCFEEGEINECKCFIIDFSDGPSNIVIFFTQDPDISWDISTHIDCPFETLDEYMEKYSALVDRDIMGPITE